VPLGAEVSPAAQTGALVVLLVAAILAESRAPAAIPETA
jgi:hypothetical protein